MTTTFIFDFWSESFRDPDCNKIQVEFEAYANSEGSVVENISIKDVSLGIYRKITEFNPDEQAYIENEAQSLADTAYDDLLEDQEAAEHGW